eukprot:scaffold1971_cov374-Prasinococcus_capsulatus_cf.AAC.5
MPTVIKAKPKPSSLYARLSATATMPVGAFRPNPCPPAKAHAQPGQTRLERYTACGFAREETDHRRHIGPPSGDNADISVFTDVSVRIQSSHHQVVNADVSDRDSKLDFLGDPGLGGNFDLPSTAGSLTSSAGWVSAPPTSGSVASVSSRVTISSSLLASLPSMLSFGWSSSRYAPDSRDPESSAA